MRDDLGDRMKNYEKNLRIYLDKDKYHVIRLDGRSFHTLSKHFKRPALPLIDTFEKATLELCSEISGACYGYHQSDEISIMFHGRPRYEGHRSELWFSGEVEKIVSSSASFLTYSFAKYFDFEANLKDDFKNKNLKEPRALFDARVITFPSLVEVANYFLWRQKDAQRNAISMLCYKYFSPKELHKKSLKERKKMLKEVHNVDNEDKRFMDGTFFSFTEKDRGERTQKIWRASAAPTFSAYSKHLVHDQDLALR